METTLPGIKSLRVFFSYSTTDKDIVGKIKHYLELIGFEVFLAHEDIEPTIQWEEEIQKNLSMADIFVAILTTEFKKSDWTDQETGMAIAGDKFIIPVQIELTPYGFINKYQSLRVNGELSNIEQAIANKISTAIIKSPRFKDGAKGFIINALAESKSFDQGGARSKLLADFESFSENEVKYIYKATMENSQLYASFVAQYPLKTFFQKYAEYLSEDELSAMIEKIKR